MGTRWQLIRSAAAALRSAYAAETGLASAPLLLPLEHVAERVHLLTVREDSNLDPHIRGELNPQSATIRLRPGMPETRRRFMIAHALGHYVLEGKALALYQEDDTTLDERAGGEIDGEAGVVRASNMRERHEQEANLFALELLVPADMLWHAVQQPDWTVERLAVQRGVSVDALCTQLANVCCLEPIVAPDMSISQKAPTITPDPHQQIAIDAPLPTLVVAGPGTGKTRTIVAKYTALVGEGVDPAHILALTFSNKAAEEMRERIVAALHTATPELAGRVEISTFHAWGLNFLKQYGHHLGLPLAIQLRTAADLYVLLRRRLADLPLEHYKDVRDPGMYLRQILSAISRAKDELCDPAAYRTLAEAEAERLITEVEWEHAGKLTQAAQQARAKAARDAARLRELAAIYERYEHILREEGMLDYGDLIMRSVEALRIPAVAATVQQQHQYILVDEFQDINYASGELVRLLDGGRGRVWAVGDPWQSIYRFRGASPVNLEQFTLVYPSATTCDLKLNYRSLQPILDASHAVMEPDPLTAVREQLTAWRTGRAARHVIEWVFDDAEAEAEASAIAHDILRRVHGSPRRLPRCARLSGRPRRMERPPPQRLRRWRFADHAVLCRTHTQADRIATTLRAHHVPIDQMGDLFDAPEVKDALAILGMIGAESSAGTLRALTIPDHALNAADLATLSRLAHEVELALPRAARDPSILTQLSRVGQEQLASLHALVDELAGCTDAWQALVRYLFKYNATMRTCLIAVARGDFAARRTLATLGQLITLAKNFVGQAPPQDRAPRHFVAYSRLLIEAGERITAIVPAEHADVVQVMTVHAAKGLEFPIVYVPTLQEGVFPPRKQYGSIPRLPGLAHGAPGDDFQEERYLLYVAMTRARDQLILSRAAARGEKPVKRSSLLPGSAEGTDAPWPILRRPAIGPCPQAFAAPRLIVSPIIQTPIPATGLEIFERCPRQYLYQYGFQLHDDLSPYLRMQEAIRDVVRDLAQRAQDGTLPNDEEALLAITWQVLADYEMTGVLYYDDYFNEAFGYITSAWRDLGGDAYAPDAVEKHYVVRRPAGEISVWVDRVESGANGVRWVRGRSGPERGDDHLSTQIMLYALAYQQEHDAAGEIVVHYTSTGALRPATPKPDVLVAHTAQIDALLEGIRAGGWRPAPGPQCARCPFNLLCPA